MTPLTRAQQRGVAAGKKLHTEVHYRLADGDDRCGSCKAYRGPDDCIKVVAPISATGWCEVGHSRKDGHAYSEKA